MVETHLAGLVVAGPPPPSSWAGAGAAEAPRHSEDGYGWPQINLKLPSPPRSEIGTPSKRLGEFEVAAQSPCRDDVGVLPTRVHGGRAATVQT